MPGLSKDFNTVMLQLGAGDLWMGVQLPATGLRPTITANAAGDLTPDGTLSVGAIHLGMTEAGSKFTYKPTNQTFFSDEQTAPVITSLQMEEATIEGNMLQVLDTTKVINLLTGGLRTSGAGFEQITFGGGQTVPTYTVLLIAPIFSDTTKIVAVELYKTFNDAGFQLDIGRKKWAMSPFKFVGQSIASRPKQDQVGIYWKTV